MIARNFRSIALFALVLLTFNLAWASQTEEKLGADGPAAATLQPVKIAYYALPGWPYCAKITTIVNGLEEEYAGKLECEILDATTAESVEQIKGYGFGNHGLVIFDGEGNVQKKMDGHLMQESQIRQALKEVMAGT